MRKSGLGDRGLNMLLSSGRDVQEPAKDGELKQLPVERICRGEYQPRISMEPAGLQELAESCQLPHMPNTLLELAQLMRQEKKQHPI